MTRTALIVMALAAMPLPVVAQLAPRSGADLEAALAFELPLQNGFPRGWNGGPADTLSVDLDAPHSGAAAARIDRLAGRTDSFSTFTSSLPVDFTGTKIELRGYLRTKDVDGFAGLWLREDGASGVLQFDNMQQRGIDGTRDWTEYRIELPFAKGARQLYFGALLSGRGTVWADDIRIFVDGKPLAEAPRVVREPTILDQDREFAAGSGMAPQAVTASQTESLALLARVWGFLKYHHPRIAAGERHWDFELFRVLPAVLAAPGPARRNAALLAWVERLGEVPACDPCAEEPRGDVHLHPEVAWIRDAESLGTGLSSYLTDVYANRPAGAMQFYVRAAPNVGNPVFDNEPAYPSMQFPDAGYQLLALFRYWNVIEYWFPNRDVIGEPWTDVLREFVPVFAAARSRDEYALALARLIARINDTHAALYGGGGAELLPPRGPCLLPVGLRFIEGGPTVVAYTNAEKGPASGLEIGDVLIELAGVRLDREVGAWLPFYSGSNQAAKLATLARTIPRGDCGPVDLVVVRAGKSVAMTAERLPREQIDLDALATHDRPGETFQMLADDVAYLKLSSIRVADIAGYLERAAGARGLVVDIRNYPSEFVVFALGRHLVDEPTRFVQFSAADLANPGAFRWTASPLLEPVAPRYGGKVVILVDDATISQAEYTAMALRASPNAVVVGGTTLGADGNVSQLSLPGGFNAPFSGLGVFYPDRSPTQRVGIVPDVVATPTVAGVRAGRDEVLERALEEIAR